MKLGEVLVFTPSTGQRSGAAGTYLFEVDRGGRKGQQMTVSAGRPATLPTGASEYHLLSPKAVGPLPDVDVLGIHYIKVRPEQAQAFERFVADRLHPAVGNLRPDLRLLYYKAVGGPDAGRYITIFALTRASRDRYWPGGSDSDELRAAFAPLKPLTKQLGTYFVEGAALMDPKFAAAVFESREWADFVLAR